MSVPAQTGKPFAPPSEALTLWPPLPPPCEQQSEGPCLIKYPSFNNPRNSDTVLNLRIPVSISRSVNAIPFKSQLCTKFRSGNCSYGSNCHFAHGIGDIRKLPPDKQGRLVENWDDDHRIISKMRLCRKFCSGEECPYGARCHFVHKGLKKVREDLGLSTKNTGISISTTGSGWESWDCRSGSDPFEYMGFVNSSLNANGVYQKPVLWKTRPCKKWETTSNGESCYFAHGKTELHKLGTHTILESGNVSVSKAHTIPAKDASASRTVIETSYKQQLQGKKYLFKRKRVEKITGIYADWIDDMPLVHSLGKVGS